MDTGITWDETLVGKTLDRLLPTLDMNTTTASSIRKLLEEELRYNAGDLKPFRAELKQLLLDRIQQEPVKPKTKRKSCTGLKKLKELGRILGVLHPKVFAELNELLNESEKEQAIRDKIALTGFEMKGNYPTKQDIAKAQMEKDRKQDLDGIDTSAILHSKRRRRS